jgi:hypothetical protein
MTGDPMQKLVTAPLGMQSLSLKPAILAAGLAIAFGFSIVRTQRKGRCSLSGLGEAASLATLVPIGDPPRVPKLSATDWFDEIDRRIYRVERSDHERYSLLEAASLPFS